MMRLLNTSTLELEEYQEGSVPPYAMLSHCWKPADNGVTYTNFMEARRTAKSGCQRMAAFCGLIPKVVPPGYTQTLQFCKLAKELGYEWVWIRECCVDEKSSAEVAGCINSLWKWTRDAGVCIAHLDDVVVADPEWVYNSRWIDESWTLTALLASRDVVFYDRDWRLLGRKREEGCGVAIEKRTGVPGRVLLEPEIIPRVSVARRMAWAGKRRTARREDVAYSLLGLFGVTLCIRYGEGDAAFQRLQRKIFERDWDETIFAWSGGSGGFQGLLAPSPASFVDCGDMVRLLPYRGYLSVQITNLGAMVCANLQVTDLHAPSGGGVVYAQKLACARTGDSSNFLDVTASMETARDYGFTQMYITLAKKSPSEPYSRVLSQLDVSSLASAFGPEQECEMINLRTEPHSPQGAMESVGAGLQDWRFRVGKIEGKALVVALPLPVQRCAGLIDHSRPRGDVMEVDGKEDALAGATQFQKRPPSYDTAMRVDRCA